MSVTINSLGKRAGLPINADWLLALVGLAALYAPTYWNAWNGIWQTDDLGHGPIILAVLAWLFWGKRQEIAAAVDRPMPSLGWFLLIVGLLTYAVGRIFNISSVEFASHLFVVTAVLLLLRGISAVRAAWFALFYLIFLVPLPATFVDMVTGPLKSWISVIVVEVLYAIGYPIARSGVVITIGQYQLLVADACSGLHSMFSLAALGTLYMYLLHRPQRWHNAVMLLSIVPIAFCANILRVITLVLVTYHLGDEAGQGFLHGFAGMVLMLAALVLFMMLDTLLVVLGRASMRAAGGGAGAASH